MVYFYKYDTNPTWMAGPHHKVYHGSLYWIEAPNWFLCNCAPTVFGQNRIYRFERGWDLD